MQTKPTMALMWLRPTLRHIQPRSSFLQLQRTTPHEYTHPPILNRPMLYRTKTTTSQPNVSTPSNPPNNSQPLQGLTVISLEQAIAAPYCTRHLADAGARVLKIERPETGDFARQYDSRVNGLSSHFVWCNRSKESVTLDLKQPKDLSVLKNLLKTADVFVQNLAPGATSRLGLSYSNLSKENPGIIVCDISGYGSTGPYSQKKAYDLLIQAESGLLSVTGTTQGENVKVGISIADIAAGMYAYTNILTALLERQKSGGSTGKGTEKGKHIDISMLECMVEWMGFPLYYSYQNQPPPKPQGTSHASIYPYGTFVTGDRKQILFGIQNEREWTILCTHILQTPSLATDPRFHDSSSRSQNREELYEIICACFERYTVEEVTEKLERVGIANAKVRGMKEVWEHEQLRARGRWGVVESNGGKEVIKGLIPPGISSPMLEFDENGVLHDHSSSTNPMKLGKIPRVGEHTQQVLDSLLLQQNKV